MIYKEFIAACESGSLEPEGTDPLLVSLYEDKRGDWDSAHTIAQSIHTTAGSRVHAYLHREEGDLSNAGYWYSKAGTTAPNITLEAEWEALAREFTQ